jgi:hypothetical protein
VGDDGDVTDVLHENKTAAEKLHRTTAVAFGGGRGTMPTGSGAVKAGESPQSVACQ